MIFFYMCISIKVTEQIVNEIVVFAANFRVFKSERKLDRKITKCRVINMQNTTIFESVFLTSFYTN